MRDAAPRTRSRSRPELEEWFNTLMTQHGASLGRLAAAYARRSADSDDLLQDIVFAIWRALPHFRGECSDRTFLFRIAHNRALAHVSSAPIATVRADEATELRDVRLDPERLASDQQRSEHLLEAVRQLPRPYAQVVTLTLEGLSYSEVADVLGISESNVGARLTRARQTLRKLMEPNHGR